ncbi:organic cation transporter protein-like [Macrobrachium rosenbergii]|uniref:organic cation transporter protein-like n=1 Tax=Macrobrachium rosenbergii TaxID=79674 RepID=UPI0034D626AC
MENGSPQGNAGVEPEGERDPLEELVHVSKNGTPGEFRLDERGAVVGISSFEDLLELINPVGRWNVATLMLCCLAAFIFPFQTITYQFLGSTPEYWCHVPALTSANWTQDQIRNLAIPIHSNDTDEKNCKFYNYNYTKAVELGYEAAMENPDSISIGDGSPIYCQSRDFNISHYSLTLVAEWDLVCERRAIYSTTQSASQIGILLGALIFGYCMDEFGRRPVILMCTVLCLLFSLGAAASPGVTLYIILRIAVSFFNVGFYTGCFVQVMELCSVTQRSSVGSLGGMPWSLGYMVVPGIAYVVRPWRWLQVMYSLPTISLFSTYWFLPESPRWLISQGRHEEAVEIFSRAAKVNGRVLPPSEALVKSLQKIAPSQKATKPEKPSRRLLSILKHFVVLLTKKEHRVKILVNYFCWCAVSMVYYGVSLNSGNLSTDPYLYMLLGGLVEIPSYFTEWFLICRLGRRNGLMICYAICGISISAVAILLAEEDEVSYGFLMFFSLTGKMAINMAFGIVYVYSAELFPTRYRTLAVGQSSMMARVGSIASPYVNDILGAAITWGPSLLFSVMSVAAAALCLLLPETRDSITEEQAAPSGKQDSSGSVQVQRKNANSNEAFEAD